MDASLREIIASTAHRGDNAGANYTHYQFYDPRQTLRISDSKFTNFWEDYCKVVHSYDLESYDPTNPPDLNIGERQQSRNPIILNMKIQFDKNTDDPEYITDDFFLEVIHVAQNIIETNFILSTDKEELFCCVLECSDQISSDRVTVRIRLHFPLCSIDTNFFKTIIVPKFIRNLRTRNIFGNLSSQPINDLESMVDSEIYDKPFPMYGSTDVKGVPPMFLRNIYGVVDEDGQGDLIDLDNIFSFYRHRHVNTSLVNISLSEKYEDTYFWLPFFLSLEYQTKVTLPIEGTDAPSSIEFSQDTNYNNDVEDSNMEKAEALITLLDQSRVEKENYWLEIGKALFNCSDGNDEGLRMWTRFTSRSETREEDDCSMYWNTFRQCDFVKVDTEALPSPFTIKTIAWYARIDNREEYEKWHREWCIKSYNKSLSCLDADVSEAVYRQYWLDFSCVSTERTKDTWRYFCKNRWMKGDVAHQKITKFVMHDFREKCREYQTDLSDRRNRLDDPNQKELLDKSIEKMGKLIRKLGGLRFTKTVVTTAGYTDFYNPYFNKFSDQNPDLMGLPNGIIECCSDKAVVRPGKPEDYITKSASVWYKNMNWEDPRVKEFMHWMRQCFVHDDLIDYFLRFMSSCLRSGNNDKIFPVFTGGANNSKSAVKRLIEGIFGSYSHTFPTSLLTQKRTGSSNATPEIALSVGAKIGWAQEPDMGTDMKGGILKELTGGDQMFVRLLHENGRNVTITFKFVFVTNKPPDFPGADKAIKERFRIFPFDSTWSHNAPIDEAEQFRTRTFKIDPYFDRRIPRMLQATLWVIIQYYTEYRKIGLDQPDRVTKATQDYWDNNDIYSCFTRECIRKSYIPGTESEEHPLGKVDMGAKVSLMDIYRLFKEWYREAYPNNKIPIRSDLKYILEQRWGKLRDGCWYGIERILEEANI